MTKRNSVITYTEMCKEVGLRLQRGMNFQASKDGFSIILMSMEPDAIYEDYIGKDKKVLIYEGHDIPNRKNGPNPKSVDQPLENKNGTYTQNGLFYNAARKYRLDKEKTDPELVKVYERIKPGTWIYRGIFKLIDAWQEKVGNRNVFKFKLELLND